MRKSKYVGLKINNVVVIQYNKRKFIVKCIECGIEKQVWINHIKDAKCNHKRRHVCINKVQTRCSGLNYTNSKEKMRYCQYCGQVITRQRGTPTCNKCHELYCIIYNRTMRAISREESKHTNEELDAIKKKYSKGVPISEIKKLVYGV